MPARSPSSDGSPRRYLITGAGGFVGRAIAAALRAADCEVVGIDLVADPAAGIVRGDTTDPRGWQDALTGCDVVIHTAAVVSNAVGRDEQWRVNVLGTRRVIEAAAAAGVRRVVHLSSVRAFSDTGFPDGVTEAHVVRPDGSPYVDTKIASEHVALAAHAAGELEVVVVRPADIYGPASAPWVLKPLAVIRSGQFVLPAMGRGLHSPVYIDDLVAGVLLAATVPAAAGQIFTLAGAESVTTREYFTHLIRFAGRRGPRCVPTGVAVALVRVIDAFNRLVGRPNEVNEISLRYLTRGGGYSIEKAQRMLGYAPSVHLDEGMRRTETWLRAEGLIR